VRQRDGFGDEQDNRSAWLHYTCPLTVSAVPMIKGS
jgi:hypothetical protein